MELIKYKAGDELAFEMGFTGQTIVIRKITKVTPSGRYVCGSVTLNPDLSLRGRDSFSVLPLSAKPVTPKIREKRERQQLVKFLKNVSFNKFDLEILRKIKRLIGENETI